MRKRKNTQREKKGNQQRGRAWAVLCFNVDSNGDFIRDEEKMTPFADMEFVTNELLTKEQARACVRWQKYFQCDVFKFQMHRITTYFKRGMLLSILPYVGLTESTYVIEDTWRRVYMVLTPVNMDNPPYAFIDCN